MLSNALTFDHLFVALPAESYEFLKSSDTWRSLFVNCRESTIRTGEGNEWTGFYCYFEDGRYIELFAEGSRTSEGYVQGAAGIALCSEHMGSSVEIERNYNLNRLGRVATSALRTFKSEKLKRNINWFTFVQAPILAKPFLKTWVMDYHKDFIELAEIPMKGPQQFDRGKFAIQEERKAGAPPVISAIKSITVACNAMELDEYSNDLLALGFRQSRSLEFSITGLHIELQPVENVGARITNVEFTMSAPTILPIDDLDIGLTATSSKLKWTLRANY